MPMERLDPAGVIELCEQERVTLSAGVPTVWMAVRDVLKAQGKTLPDLRRLIIGGSAMPRSLLDDLEAIGIEVQHAWGMTEMSPIGTMNVRVAELEDQPALQHEKRYTQGTFSPIVEWRLVDDARPTTCRPTASRAASCWCAASPSPAPTTRTSSANTTAFEPDGWFHTGDVCTVDQYGYMEIVDRVKDFIKSGGEWISSVEVENTLMGHPALKEACVFGIPHPKWQERPVAAVVLREGHEADEDAIRALAGRQARQVADARPGDVRRRDPAHGGRQVPQARPARALRQALRGRAGLGRNNQAQPDLAGSVRWRTKRPPRCASAP